MKTETPPSPVVPIVCCVLIPCCCRQLLIWTVGIFCVSDERWEVEQRRIIVILVALQARVALGSPASHAWTEELLGRFLRCVIVAGLWRHPCCLRSNRGRLSGAFSAVGQLFLDTSARSSLRSWVLLLLGPHRVLLEPSRAVRCHDSGRRAGRRRGRRPPWHWSTMKLLLSLQ